MTVCIFFILSDESIIKNFHDCVIFFISSNESIIKNLNDCVYFFISSDESLMKNLKDCVHFLFYPELSIVRPTFFLNCVIAPLIISSSQNGNSQSCSFIYI